jgi:hypothetical protein
VGEEEELTRRQALHSHQLQEEGLVQVGEEQVLHQQQVEAVEEEGLTQPPLVAGSFELEVRVELGMQQGPNEQQGPNGQQGFLQYFASHFFA